MLTESEYRRLYYGMVQVMIDLGQVKFHHTIIAAKSRNAILVICGRTP